MVKEARPRQSARFASYIKAGVEHVEAFALLSNKDASDYFDLVLQSVRKGGTVSLPGVYGGALN